MIDLSQNQIEYLSKTVYNNPYIKCIPTEKQITALLETGREVLFGGAAGGGKSVWLLMAALQHINEPNYNAILIRDTYANLSKPEGLMDVAHAWLADSPAKWEGKTSTYRFPSGARVSFGYLDSPLDHFNYQGAAYQFVGIDEIVNIREHQALYLFSRLRKLLGLDVPIRLRCASNPPAAEQIAKGAWVKRRYVDEKTRGDRVFIPARIVDNPHLDADQYINDSLSQLDSITRKQLQYGDWEIKAVDRFFETSKIKIVDSTPATAQCVRRWDFAATPEPPPGSSDDPDYTVGLKVGFDGDIIVYDMMRGRWGAGETNRIVKQTATMDGVGVLQVLEQEPGSSGKREVIHFMDSLKGYPAQGKPSTGSKIVRARPVSSWIAAGRVKIVAGPWNKDFLSELAMFPDGEHDDIVDTLSGAWSDLNLTDDNGGITTVAGIGAKQTREAELW